MAAPMEGTPVRIGAAPPYGHVIVNERWRGSAIVQGFQGKLKAIFEEGLGLVDFHLSDHSCVLYVSESGLVAGNGYRRKLFQFRKASKLHGIIVVEKTRLSEQYFPAVQKFVVFELGLTLLPVASQSEASQLIAQLVHDESKEESRNPFLRKKAAKLCEPVVLALVQQIPGVGRVKALALLRHFPSIHQLSNATAQQLEAAVGAAAAQSVRGFFHTSLAPPR
nr:PREDICTED: Fanconi anemia core complex-associated protein 24 [Lepisosteus oculatus]XP_015223501.1 PREDICTED: Fanconi anemia core complex-associated protein 24 [Lepisosteus oculatus]XP_015223502.1 PREDICTED: Fanconi anemia core complex-associated protein 24 [Lepisosteus oculatus]